jgi:putative serine protease PepD
MTVAPGFAPADPTRANHRRLPIPRRLAAGYRSPHVLNGSLTPSVAPNAPAPQPLRASFVAMGAIAMVIVSALVGAVTALAVRPLDFGSVAAGTARSGIRMLGGPVERVAAKVLPSVVKLEMAVGREFFEGSGIILRSDGLILTNDHVVTVPSGVGAAAPREVTTLVTFADGSSAPFAVIGGDTVSDIAVVRAQGASGLDPIELGSSDHLEVGQSVVAIGAPLGLDGTVTTGIISALNRPVPNEGNSATDDGVYDAIQTDAAINPGNSGGALVDMNGALIGVSAALATTGGDYVTGPGGSIGLGFAIPVDQAMRVVGQLVATGKASHSTLGAQVTGEHLAHGARIVAVTPRGPAAAAGIPLGAVVTRVDDRVIVDADALTAAVQSKAPGDTVVLTYTDPSGAVKTAHVTLGAD